MFFQTIAAIKVIICTALDCIFHDGGTDDALEQLFRVITFNQEDVLVAAFFEHGKGDEIVCWAADEYVYVRPKRCEEFWQWFGRLGYWRGICLK